MKTISLQDFEQYRIAHKITKKEMANRLGVSYMFFVALMKGRKNLTENLILRFEKLQKTESERPRFIAVPLVFTDSEWRWVQAHFGVSTISEAEEVLRNYIIAQSQQTVAAAMVPPPPFGETVEPFA